VRLSCRLREIRGKRTIAEVASAAGVNEGELSKIERGLALPRDEWLEGLELAYGAARHDWYPPALLLHLQGDETS
jgi:transcriptional regulator with XRE-family HTH domain